MIEREPRARVLAVGIGSPHGDDQIGWLVVRELVGSVQDDVVIRTAHEPAELLDWLDEVQELVVCDACRSGCKIGTLRRWTWPTDSLVTHVRSGSHDLTLPFVLALADRLGKLPKRVTVWGIESGDASPVVPLSDALRNAVPRIVQTVADDMAVPRSRRERGRHA